MALPIMAIAKVLGQLTVLVRRTRENFIGG